jgi:uncharacterized membrane protein
LTLFVAALLVFLDLHMVPAIPPLRAGLVGALVRRSYLVGYSLVSLLTLTWLFHATMRLDFVPLMTLAAA